MALKILGDLTTVEQLGMRLKLASFRYISLSMGMHPYSGTTNRIVRGARVGSLSNSVFERRTSTGSGLFASLGSGSVETLG